MKDQLASWRHSADTATIERRSKVIDGRIHDARRAEKRKEAGSKARIMKDIAALVCVRCGSPRRCPSCAGILRAPRARGVGDNEAFATVLPASELEQSAFVAFLPKNGLHRASRRLQGDPTLERVEGQF
jgi:hypothetical protein